MVSRQKGNVHNLLLGTDVAEEDIHEINLAIDSRIIYGKNRLNATREMSFAIGET